MYTTKKNLFCACLMVPGSSLYQLLSRFLWSGVDISLFSLFDLGSQTYKHCFPWRIFHVPHTLTQQSPAP